MLQKGLNFALNALTMALHPCFASLPHTQHSLPVQSEMHDVKINDWIVLKRSPLQSHTRDFDKVYISRIDT